MVPYSSLHPQEQQQVYVSAAACGGMAQPVTPGGKEPLAPRTWAQQAHQEGLAWQDITLVRASHSCCAT